MIEPTEIAETANQVHKLLDDSRLLVRHVDRELAVVRALELSCGFLTRFLADETLERYRVAVEQGDAEARHHDPRIRNALALVAGGGAHGHDPHHFDFFLNKEHSLLIAAGFDSEIADFVIKGIRDGIHDAVSQPLSYLAFHNVLTSLKGYICGRARALKRRLEAERIRKGLVYTLGGGGICVLNWTAPGWSAVGIGASTLAGGSLFKKGLDIFTDEFGV